MSDTTESSMDPQARLHELMGAAALGPLSSAEAEELQRLLEAEPDARRELDELRATVDRLPSAGSGVQFDATPSSGLEERVAAAVNGPPAPTVLVPAVAAHRSRLWVLAAAAAVLVIAAGLGGWAVGQREPGVPTGPPGTFGVTELISFTGEPRGVEIEASIVAHTWGTETVMTIDGLEQGTYTVQVVGTDGESVDSGTFIAPARGITDCRMIAALLRQEADIIVVSDSDGDVVMRSQLPETT
ncbi:MAG: hypothetical protein H0U62_06445 [Actinobacteria bacterium]|nr:hypothetical protein [Actinomycetota bacterium]